MCCTSITNINWIFLAGHSPPSGGWGQERHPAAKSPSELVDLVWATATIEVQLLQRQKGDIRR